jgi:hypothetical protein
VAQIKGLGILELVKMVKKAAREKGIADVAQALDLRGSAILSGHVISSTWYPYEEFVKLLRGSQQLLDGGDPHFFETLGRMKAEIDLSNALHSFSPQNRVNLAAFIPVMCRIWGAYLDTGDMRITDSGPGHACFVIEGAPHLIPENCAVVGGWICRAYEISGEKDVCYVHDKCVSKGNPICEYQVCWADG